MRSSTASRIASYVTATRSRENGSRSASKSGSGSKSTSAASVCFLFFSLLDRILTIYVRPEKSLLVYVELLLNIDFVVVIVLTTTTVTAC